MKLKWTFAIVSIVFVLAIVSIFNDACSQILQDEHLAKFEDPILGIGFQYPVQWGPPTISQENSADIVAFSPKYANSSSDIIIESRYREIIVKVENFFPVQIDLTQYMQNTFSKSRFLEDYNLIESDKMATLGGSPAYKLVYTYHKGTQGDNVKVVSTNIFTVKNNIAYNLSFEIPVNLHRLYLPGLEKMTNTFTLN